VDEFSALLPDMFDGLQKKWKVTGGQLILIILTFAVGGSITGYVAKKLMNVLAIQQDWLWAIIYILLITLLWPLAVIIISIPFGQFSFFIKYIRKIGAKIGLVKKTDKENQTSKVKRIAIFASGTGSNAQKIIDYFRTAANIRIDLIVCNNPEAGVLGIAVRENIPTLIIEKERFFRGDAYIKELQERNIDFIVLAGFLWKIPSVLIRSFSGRIINIHPALLPKYGGKGMYGHRVHEAVIEAGEKESGISIHYVDELYDHGKTIFQVRCPVYENDTPDLLAQRIHALEHEHYPRIIESLLK
jgi:formyltetrahydrofolate-dependent phosphoribosylglycinamide formyltransferase